MAAAQVAAAPALVVSGAPAVAASPPVALYVGDLHPDVSDAVLFDLFSQVEGFVSVHLCRNSLTMASLCYAYVNYNAMDCAIQAIRKFNHSLVFGRPMRVMISCRDPDARRSGVGNLFVKNLADSIDNVKLHEMFAKFGNILSCKVATFIDGKSKGYGFVQFEAQESAYSAIEELNGSDFEGKQLYVSNFIKRSERVLPDPDKFTNLYIKNLDQDITEELLKLKFSEFGKITNLAIAKDDEGNPRGFAFINFENPVDAKRAVEAMNGLQLGSKALYVAKAQKKSERQQILRQLYEEKKNERIMKNMASNLYVKNIVDNVDDDELREHFSSCGTITSVKVMKDEKGISRGFGFICFSNSEEAKEAVKKHHGYMFHGKPLYVAFAQRKEERQAQLQIQFAQHIVGIAGSTAPVIPPGYPFYYSPHPGVMPQIPPRHGFMYPPLGMRPGWRPGSFAPARPGFQPLPLPVIPNVSRQHRQNRGRVNGHLFPQNGHSLPYISHLQQSNYINLPKDASNQPRAGHTKHIPNGRPRDMKNGSIVPSAGLNAQGTEMLSTMLAAASPQQQKQILGEQLFPLVQSHKADLAAKITGMLLEMDNSELLLLLDSPDSLAAKVEEAVQVLKLSQTTVGSEEAVPPKYLSSEVSVS